MRKHFLILMLLTLLPLAGFATDYEVVLYNASKTFGDLDPTRPAANWFKVDPSGDKATLRNGLLFMRAPGAANQGEDAATYRYTVEQDPEYDTNSFMVSGDAAFTIKPRTMEASSTWIAFELKNQQFRSETAFELTPEDFVIKVTLPIYGSTPVELTAGEDFTISAQANNAGAYGANAGHITIKGKGNYAGSKTFDYDISGTDISTLATAQYNGPALYYKGEAYTTTDPQFANTNFSITGLTAGTHFQVKAGSIENGTHAGDLTVKLEGVEAAGFSGTQTVTIPIKKYVVPANGLAYTAGTAPVYTGSALAPVGTFKVAGTELPNLAATDFEFVESTLDVNASTTNKADLVFKSAGDYEFAAGTTKQEITYEIAKRVFSDGTVTASFDKDANNDPIVNYPYDNKAITPHVTVTFVPVVGGDEITLTTNDYTLTYKDHSGGNDLKKVEDAKTLTITGKGNFTEVSLDVMSYNVKPRALKVKANDLTVGVGAEVTPTFTYDSWANGESLATLGTNVNPATQAVKYKVRGGSAEYTQAQIQAAPQGTYDIIPLTTGYTNDTKFANYAFEAVNTPTYGTLTKTTSQVVVKIVNREITWGENFPTASGWTVEHVSGLSEKEAEVRAETGDPGDPVYESVMEKIIAALTQNKFKLVNAAANPLDANEDGYDVYYDGVIETGGYVATVTNGKLKVNKYVVVPTDITIAAAGNYTGQAVTPAVTLKVLGNTVLVSPKYYTVTYDADFNAGDHKAKITANTSNFTTTHDVCYNATEVAAYNTEHAAEIAAGELQALTTSTVKETLTYVEQGYTINKINLTFTVKDYTGETGKEAAWTYGTTEPTYRAALTAGTPVAGEETLIANVLAGQKPEGFNGYLVVKRTSGNTVGTYTDALVASFVDEEGNDITKLAEPLDPAVNYNIDYNHPGTLVIEKGTIVARVKSMPLPYGETVDNTTFHLEAVSGMDLAEAANFDAIVKYEHAPAKFGWKGGAKALTLGPTTLTYSTDAADKPTATNYNVVFAEGDAAKGTLTVTKRPVKFHAINKTVDYANLATDPVITGLAVNDTYIAQDVVAGEYYSLLSGHTMSTLIKSIAFASKNVGDNDIVLTPTDKADILNVYEITLESGTLTVTHAALSELVLRRIEQADFDDPLKNTAEAEIETNNGKFVDVSFTFPGQTMYANKWYTMVLPFATTVREISKAFGYAVVDVFNTNGNNPDDVAFSLHIGTVNANEPFLIKVDQDITADDFEDPSGPMIEAVKIEKPASAIELSDAYGNKIVGTYSGINGGFDADYDWGLGLGKTATDWQPFNKQFVRPLGAYIHYKDRQSHNARTISIEEPDGSTTVINSVTGDQINFSKDAIYNMNGVKMQSIPTEKGVYIQNGKKIVIK